MGGAPPLLFDVLPKVEAVLVSAMRGSDDDGDGEG
jgi:hypothetical protein